VVPTASKTKFTFADLRPMPINAGVARREEAGGRAV